MRLAVTLMWILLFTGLSLNAFSQHFPDPPAPFKNITLEMSLKPFRVLEDAFVEDVCRTLFRQWHPLTKHADTISILLWTADGSEILDYRGKPEDPIEWARYIGMGNSKYEPGSGPEELTLHQRPYLYTESPPDITYGALHRIIETLKTVGAAESGKPIRVGATFDPGPEFTKSSFKFERHPEICMGNTIGKASFVCCYATLHADTVAYAGYPDGIPEGTPFGSFFGRQCQHFLTDLGFDYIWFSNGLGFGLETWGVTGAVFDGERFDTARIEDVRDKILNFWMLFRAECPDFPIETRGTNLSTGIDLGSDAVPLRDIYRGGFNLLPPPNSPWAALDGDFGLELTGYMSRIAELPGEEFLFRYYTHDPWWLNSPWLDRYGREPHDIYLPMAVARLDQTGTARIPTHLAFLTIDNSFGGMPDEVPNEVIPHILRARAASPDQPGPVVWVYPFDEYHDMTFSGGRVNEAFFGDWFMRQALNTTFPINTVVSTGNLVSSLQIDPRRYVESVLVSIVPDSGSPLETALFDTVARGGKVLLYGPADHASARLLDALHVEAAEPLSGEFDLSITGEVDAIAGDRPLRLNHRPLMSAGGLTHAMKPGEKDGILVLAEAAQGEQRRVAAVMSSLPEWHGGALAWVRGTSSMSYQKGGRLLTPDNPSQWFIGPVLLRHALNEMGYRVSVAMQNATQRYPVLAVARHEGGFFFSGYSPDTTVALQFRFPQGAPLFIGGETRIRNGCSVYTVPRAWHKECRAFVEGQDGRLLSCVEVKSGQYGIVRKLRVAGLENATVRIYPPAGVALEDVRLSTTTENPPRKNDLDTAPGDPMYGRHIAVRNITGQLFIAW